MKLIVLKPTSPSKRHYLNIFNKISKIRVLKVKSKINKNFIGLSKIFTYYRYTKNKKLFEKINFIMKNNIIGVVYSIEYDSNRNANIAAIFDFKRKSFFYIIAPKNLKVGHIIKTGREAEKKVGHCIELNKIPIGCPVYNISVRSGGISEISKSAGTFSLLINKSSINIKIVLSSGKKKSISTNSFGYIGMTSNEFFFLKQLGKAGRSKWLGIKPSVRGVAMNPVDHPNGGGEGRKSSKNKNPWGKIKYSKKN